MGKEIFLDLTDGSINEISGIVFFALRLLGEVDRSLKSALVTLTVGMWRWNHGCSAQWKSIGEGHEDSFPVSWRANRKPKGCHSTSTAVFKYIYWEVKRLFLPFFICCLVTIQLEHIQVWICAFFDYLKSEIVYEAGSHSTKPVYVLNSFFQIAVIAIQFIRWASHL